MNQEVNILFPNSISLVIKREDLLHPFISGNKFRKLKYNLIEAKAKKHQTLLTFGGAYSNHIAAVAYAGKEQGFKTIGIIRGEELVNKVESNPTLHFARKCGMEFHFISREEYRTKNETNFIENLKTKFGKFYLLPEGGTNQLAIKGCQEILEINDLNFDYVCCAVGTGGTIAGIINSAAKNQKILGFSSLKSDFLKKEICNFVNVDKNWEIITNYTFGGYGKVNDQLINFINNFKDKTNIPLDPIYTGKMIFGIVDMIQNNYFPKNSKILAIHTGGLQGIKGMNQKLNQKQFQVINGYD